jgi:hypothetical protein
MVGRWGSNAVLPTGYKHESSPHIRKYRVGWRGSGHVRRPFRATWKCKNARGGARWAERGATRARGVGGACGAERAREVGRVRGACVVYTFAVIDYRSRVDARSAANTISG